MLSSTLEYVHNIGCACRVGKQHLFQPFCADATPYGHGKEVHHLFGMETKEVRAKDALAPFCDYDLVSVSPDVVSPIRRELYHCDVSSPWMWN